MKHLWYWSAIVLLIFFGIMFGGFALIMYAVAINFMLAKDSIERGALYETAIKERPKAVPDTVLVLQQGNHRKN